MENQKSSCIKGNPENSINSRIFRDGSTRSGVLLRSCAVGFGIYKPGWKWSSHAGKQSGKSSENHVGYILSGAMIIQDSAGNETTIRAGEAFEVGPGHDAWVLGDEPCTALDFVPPV